MCVTGIDHRVRTTFGGGAGTPAAGRAQWFNDVGVEPHPSGGVCITSNGGVGWLGAVSAAAEDGCSGVARNEATVANEGTTMKSTVMLTSDSWARPVRVDMGWPACDERLVTVAEAIAHRVAGVTSQLPDVR